MFFKKEGRIFLLLSETMKALVCDAYGSIECAKYHDIPDPEPGPGEVLVAVKAAGAVFTDVLFARGEYQVKPPLPFVLGCELAGEVVYVGHNVTRLAVGDRVVSLAMKFGAFAEKIVLPEWLPSRLPDQVGYEAGAALMSSGGTAQFALRQRAALLAGETLVVSGAAGGTGSAAIQIGKAIGARVIAVCSSEARAAFCRRLGADDTIDYSGEDINTGLKARTDGRGADVVFETVGGDVFDACARAMAMEGRLLVVGFASGRIPSLPANLPLLRQSSLIGVHWLTFVERHPDQHAANMAELIGWLEAGVVAPQISSVVPLADGVSALRLLEQRQVVGKIIVRP